MLGQLKCVQENVWVGCRKRSQPSDCWVTSPCREGKKESTPFTSFVASYRRKYLDIFSTDQPVWRRSGIWKHSWEKKLNELSSLQKKNKILFSLPLPQIYTTSSEFPSKSLVSCTDMGFCLLYSFLHNFEWNPILRHPFFSPSREGKKDGLTVLKKLRNWLQGPREPDKTFRNFRASKIRRNKFLSYVKFVNWGFRYRELVGRAASHERRSWGIIFVACDKFSFSSLHPSWTQQQKQQLHPILVSNPWIHRWCHGGWIRISGKLTFRSRVSVKMSFRFPIVHLWLSTQKTGQ